MSDSMEFMQEESRNPAGYRTGVRFPYRFGHSPG